jgi:predicted RNA methylase
MPTTMEKPVPVRDAMQFVNEQDAATRRRFIERLEFRATDPTFVAYRDAYLDLIALERTAVLDLGCGTGVVARAIAGRDGFAGTVPGVDQSPEFIAAAERLAADDGVGARVEFADARAGRPRRSSANGGPADRRIRGAYAGRAWR